jgi:hypothetical protein
VIAISDRNRLGLPRSIFRQGVGRSTSETTDLSPHCSDCEGMLVCARPSGLEAGMQGNQSADHVRSKQEAERNGFHANPRMHSMDASSWLCCWGRNWDTFYASHLNVRFGNRSNGDPLMKALTHGEPAEEGNSFVPQLNCTLSPGLWTLLQAELQRTRQPVAHIVTLKRHWQRCQPSSSVHGWPLCPPTCCS